MPKPNTNQWTRGEINKAKRLLRSVQRTARDKAITKTRGLSHAEAGRRVGVSASTMRRWRQQRTTGTPRAAKRRR